MLEDWLEKLKAQKVMVLAACAGLILAAVIGAQVLARSTPPADFPEVELASSSTAETASSTETEELERAVITVDVKGAVAKEGLYELPAGSRVNDAINQAGGLLETADKKSINLAQKLTDEAVVYVASQGENISVVAENALQTNTTSDGKVNLNTADESQLQTITGIGSKKAKDIIAHRETVGLFTSVDDLKQVAGIGDKTLEKIRSEVTVD